MLQRNRNFLQSGDWILRQIELESSQGILESFDCGDPDLNDYFRNDALLNKESLVGQPYFLHIADVDQTPVALIDLCNDAVRKHGSKKHPGYADVAEIEPAKQYEFLPAVKITRFGVNAAYQRHGVGSYSINMLKTLFTTENRTGCRFLTVDAYNKPNVLSFYQKNDFKFFSEKDVAKETRAMFFDLKRYRYSVVV